MSHREPPTLDAPRASLRALSEADVPALLVIFSNAQVARYTSRPPFASEADAVALLGRVQEGLRDQSAYQWGLARKSDDLVIGTCTLFQIDRSNGRAELGYALGREHWGQGHMAEALVALVAHGFFDLGLRRLEADVDPRNLPSIRSLERLGFEREGYLRERWNVGGEIQDALWYGLLAREWRARR